MSVHLKFAPGQIAQVADGGHNVGAYLRAGDDGTLIGHDSDSLKVSVTNSLGIDVDLDHAEDSVRIGDGTNLVTVTNVASDYGMDVNLINASIAVTATDLDIRALTQTDEITAYQGTSPWVVSATDLDIRDLSASQDNIAVSDGTDTLAIETDGSINVNASVAPPNTAIENTATAVSAVAVNVVASALPNREKLAYANEGNKSVYFGKTGVTKDNGFPCHPGMQHFWEIGPSITPQFIGETGASSEDMRVIEFS